MFLKKQQSKPFQVPRKKHYIYTLNEAIKPINKYFEVDDVFITYEEDVVVENTNPFVSRNYRYGFQGQERDDEVSGKGNSYTAEFWEYSPRIGRRWNRDPITYPWQSPYVINNNNPIYFLDSYGLWGSKKKAERKRDKFIKKHGEEGVGKVINRNKRNGKKADWGFSIIKDNEIDVEVEEKENRRFEDGVKGPYDVTVSAKMPDYVYSNKDYKKAKSKYGLYTPMIISLDLNIIFGGGASFEIGWAQDKFGGRTGIFTVGGGVGLDLGVGLNAGVIEETGDKIFTVDQLKGKGMQYGGGVGPITVTKAGDVKNNHKTIEFEGANFNIVTGGAGNDLKMLNLLNLGKMRVGGSYQWNKTSTFQTMPKK